jgi:hypothetical protein
MGRNVLVEVTLEEKAYPIESALLPDENENFGWRAGNPGTQIIRRTFDEPQALRRIRLVCEDTEKTRTQEFVLRWSPGTGRSFREIVRQQWFATQSRRRTVALKVVRVSVDLHSALHDPVAEIDPTIHELLVFLRPHRRRTAGTHDTVNFWRIGILVQASTELI